MKQILVFLTLIGLLLVNQLNAQDVEYFNEKNPRPEEVTLLPTMEDAHRGTNFSFNEVKMAHETGYNSLVPVDVQKTFAQEKFRTLFEYYENQDNIDSWIGTNTILGTNPDEWATTSWSYLEEGPTPTGVILSGGYQSKKASGSDVGPKMIERKPYKKGDRGYKEDEKFLYLDLGKICSLPKYQGVKVLWISLGCGNHVFPYTPPTLTDVPAQDVVEKRQQESSGGQGVWGSDWVVVNNTYYETYNYTTQMPPQQFSYVGMQFQWGFNYNPCWWSPAVPIFQNGCWGCNSYVPQPQTIINEGDTYVTNEGDTYINEGDVINEGDIVIVNNNNNNPPDVDEPDPDDDGGPVLPPNGDPDDDDDGGPVLGDNGPVLGENGDGNGNNNDNEGGGNLGGSGMVTHDDESSNQTQTKNSQPTTSSFSDIARSSESKYWANSKDVLLAQREQTSRNNGGYSQNESRTNPPSSSNAGKNPPSSKPNNWTSEGASTRTPQNGGTLRPVNNSGNTPQQWNNQNNLTAQREPTVSGNGNGTSGSSRPAVKNPDTTPQQWSGQNTASRNPTPQTSTQTKPSLNTAEQYSRRPQSQNEVSARPNPSQTVSSSKPSSGRGNQTPSPSTFQRNPNGGSKSPVSPIVNSGATSTPSSGGGKVPATTGQTAPQAKNPGGGMVSPARMGGGGTVPAPAMGGGGGGRVGGRR